MPGRPRHSAGCQCTSVGLLVALLAPSPSARATATPGVIQLVAGGTGYGPASNVAQMPKDMLVADGTLYATDTAYNTVRAMDLATGYQRVIAGNATPRYSGNGGDGGPALEAQLSDPSDLAIDRDGNLYVIDSYRRVRKVDRAGTITTVAGGGTRRGESIPAIEAEIDLRGITHDGTYLYISDPTAKKIFRVDPQGVMTTFAGVGPVEGPRGDGVPATAAWVEP